MTKDELNFDEFKELVMSQQKKPELTPRSNEGESDLDSDGDERERALLELSSVTSQSRHHAGLALTLGSEDGPRSWIDGGCAIGTAAG